jgi:hypothetical protein
MRQMCCGWPAKTATALPLLQPSWRAAGLFHQACCAAAMAQLPSVKQVVCFACHQHKAQAFADGVTVEHGIPCKATIEIDVGFRRADAIRVAAYGGALLHVKDAWIRDGGPGQTCVSYSSHGGKDVSIIP